ncbi:oligosaccharide flippase family protein [Roseovarius salis]|uniref:oligosaccharide flippase family protein n=1 Tax=Roseovarius salis TaxID=3376063 RepID=UPI0037CB4A4E
MLPASLTSPFVIGMASRLVVQVFALAQIMIASRYLGLAEFGSYALAWAVASIFHAFIFTGFYHIFLRSRTPDEDRDTIFGIMLAVALVAAGLMLCVGILIGDRQALTSHMFLALAAVPLIEAVNAWNEAHLLREARMRTANVITGVAEVSATAALIAGLLGGIGPLSLVLARYAANGLKLILSSSVVRRMPRPGLDIDVLRRGAHTALSLWVTSGSAMLVNYGGDLILGAFLSPSVVGAYRGGARISQTASDLVQQPLTMLSWSRFSRLEKVGHRRQIGLYWRVNVAFGTAAGWPLLICVALLSEELVAVVLDETWLPAAVVISIMSVGRAMRLISTQLEPTLTNFDQQKLLVKIRLFGFALVGLALLFYGRYGAEHAATAHLMAALVMAAISIVVTQRVLALTAREMMLTFVPAITLTALCAAFVWMTQPLRAGPDPADGFFLTLSGLFLLWCGGVALALSKRVLRWPIP